MKGEMLMEKVKSFAILILSVSLVSSYFMIYQLLDNNSKLQKQVNKHLLNLIKLTEQLGLLVVISQLTKQSLKLSLINSYFQN